jgi:hypothetical protein
VSKYWTCKLIKEVVHIFNVELQSFTTNHLQILRDVHPVEHNMDTPEPKPERSLNDSIAISAALLGSRKQQ